MNPEECNSDSPDLGDSPSSNAEEEPINIKLSDIEERQDSYSSHHGYKEVDVSIEDDEDIGPEFIMKNKNASFTEDNPTYSSKQTQQSVFGDAFTRCVYFACSLFIFSILSFALWFFNVDKNLDAGFALSAFGALVIFFGGFGGIILSILHRTSVTIPSQWIVLDISMGLYIMGGVCYMIGGCALANAYNKSTEYSSAYAGTWFAEAVFVGTHAIVAGLDLWKQIMDSRGLRLFIYGGLYFFVALVLFFCYAIISDTSSGHGHSESGLIASGYFFGMILVAFSIALRLCPIGFCAKLATSAMYLALAIAFSISIFFSVVGYWAIAADSGITEFSAYWVGFSFFLTLMGTQIAIDIRV
eukprot:40315_1